MFGIEMFHKNRDIITGGGVFENTWIFERVIECNPGYVVFVLKMVPEK
jgi:hypothetical protein